MVAADSMAVAAFTVEAGFTEAVAMEAAGTAN
jgi:hypothetical protein